LPEGNAAADQKDVSNTRRWPSLLLAVLLLGAVAWIGRHLFQTALEPVGHLARSAERATDGNGPEAIALLTAGDAGYVEPGACEGCHQDIWKTYQHTGMARSFARPAAGNMVADFTTHNTYYHNASGRYYTMLRRDGKYYQRRHQLGPDGKITNVIEKEINFVMGSGNHARTYLHQTRQGTLLELPVGWYPEKGGHWAMNPGYDRPNHDGFRREIGYDCMFCHNGYPEIKPGADAYGAVPVFPGKIPEGIDCQRCHGPGGDHVRAAQSANPGPDAIRSSIVNPSRLSPERQLEICMQCHLESSSRPLPYAMVRYGRGAFSYRPGEPLADYALHFDHAAGTSPPHFEIAHAAYRLRQSACFQESQGALTCVTCHDPHHAVRGKEAIQQYRAACLGCHRDTLAAEIAATRHTADQDCLRCHMPKRRTDDAVHVVMTDHFIQRHRPTGDLEAPLSEQSTANQTGEVVLYYPTDLPAKRDKDLYLAVAQVIEGANLKPGIERLELAIREYIPAQGEFYYELAQAYRSAGQPERALAMYEEALTRKKDFLPALVHLGETLEQTGNLRRAAEILERAVSVGQRPPAVLAELSSVYLRAGRVSDAERTAREALQGDPELPEASNSLGMTLFTQGRMAEAAAGYREAIRVRPNYSDGHYNLGNLLAIGQDLEAAIWHYRQALQAAPDIAETHHNLAAALALRREYAEAKRHFERAVQLKPDYHAAHLNLGNLEMRSGNRRSAQRHFEKAAESPDPTIRSAAAQAIGGGPAPPTNP
jgi:predicted CXXCH cytochrome family protein